jgi:alpha-galactosidase/6-phospho-beta-glucosidase family protein
MLAVPDRDIMQLLNMQPSTYYRYKRQMLQQNAEAIANRTRELVYEDLQVTQQRLEQKLRELQEMIDNPSTRAKERIEAIKLHGEITLNIARLQVETPKVLALHDEHSPLQLPAADKELLTEDTTDPEAG